MQIETTVQYHLAHIRLATERLEPTGAGEDAEKRGPHALLEGT